MNSEELTISIIALVIFAGVGLMVGAMMNRRRFRELEHRERLAMIERGLLPSPESDPAGFDRGAGLHPIGAETGVRYRTAGVLMMGVGLAFLVLLTFTANSFGAGVGIGGGWAILGAASLFNYFLISSRREQESTSSRRWNPPAARPPEPPRAGSL